MTTGHFFLTGHDFEGDTRETWTMTLADAIKSARQMTNPTLDGPPWQDWEIWGNDEATDEWKPLITSDSL